MIIDRLFDAVEKCGPVCVGLDTSPKLLPQVLAAEPAIPSAILEFNRRIIDATVDLVSCYKVQIAHYESLGVEGLSCYRDTIRYARGKGTIVIGDIKRGDIASTGEMYAQAHFSGDFETDFVTLNPYMGSDVITPFLPYLEREEKGIFILMRTSNISAEDFQDLHCINQPLFMHVARRVSEWGKDYRGSHGYSLIGGVVGATGSQELAIIRRSFPGLFLLIPGYGAQGAGGQEVSKAFIHGNGALINASRSILGAHKNRADADRRFDDYAREATLRMKKDIRGWTR